jgi:hypothetical protein
MRNVVVRQICVVIVFLILVTSVSAGDATFSKTRETKKPIPNVVIIVLSGVSNSESINDQTHQFLPNLWHSIIDQGTLYSNVIPLDCQFHMPVVGAILTGLVYPFSGHLRAPSIFQYVKKAYSIPSNKLWVLGEWDRDYFGYKTTDYPQDTFPSQLVALTYEMSSFAYDLLNDEEKIFVEKYKKLKRGWPQWDSLSAMQFTIFEKIMFKLKPVLIVDIMNDVESAHYDTYARYVLALRENDERIYKIWNIIQNDPFYKDNTYLIITPDHARNEYYMHHNDSIGDMALATWIYIYGPKIKKGAVINREVHHIDLFPTLTNIFNVSTHKHRGQRLGDCFEK